jgi:integrase
LISLAFYTRIATEYDTQRYVAGLGMPRQSTKLTPTPDGSWKGRKRIPEDVRDAFNGRWEVFFRCGPMPETLARARYRAWLSEIETQIANVRAAKHGGGQMLTAMQARALSGDWYHWFTARHLPNAKAWGADFWEHRAEELGDNVRDAMDAFWKSSGKPWHPDVELMEIYEEDPAAKARGLAIVADHAESSQFLHTKGMLLEPASREMFLDCLVHDYFAAIRLLIRRANDDYGTDKWPERFPKFEKTGDPGLTPWMLFDLWIKGKQPAPGTVTRWRVAFLKLRDDFPEQSAAALTPEQAQRWALELVNSERSAGVVRDAWVRACRTVFEWARRQKLIASNPFADVHISVPRKTRLREGREFSAAEIRTILSAALAIGQLRTKTDAVRRWVPWLLAYTGARAGEITQLRGADVSERDGIPAIKVSPDAGSVKTRQARTVPLHDHLIEQGFLAFVKASGQGPLFHNEPTGAARKDDPTKPRKPLAVKAREHLAAWVRQLGVEDREISPNHAWRHTFKLIGHRADISERLLDAIVGHAPPNVGRGYGEPTFGDKAEALKRFPRYEANG